MLKTARSYLHSSGQNSGMCITPQSLPVPVEPGHHNVILPVELAGRHNVILPVELAGHHNVCEKVYPGSQHAVGSGVFPHQAASSSPRPTLVSAQLSSSPAVTHIPLSVSDSPSPWHFPASWLTQEHLSHELQQTHVPSMLIKSVES